MLKRILTAVVLLAVVFGTILGLRQVYVEPSLFVFLEYMKWRKRSKKRSTMR